MPSRFSVGLDGTVLVYRCCRTEACSFFTDSASIDRPQQARVHDAGESRMMASRARTELDHTGQAWCEHSVQACVEMVFTICLAKARRKQECRQGLLIAGTDRTAHINGNHWQADVRFDDTYHIAEPWWGTHEKNWPHRR